MSRGGQILFGRYSRLKRGGIFGEEEKMKGLFMFGATFALSILIGFLAMNGERVGDAVALPETSVTETQVVHISVENQLYGGVCRFYEGELYVDLADYAEIFASSALTAEEKTDVFVTRGKDLILEAIAGKEYLSVNEVYYWCPGGNIREGDRLFVPFHILTKALGGTVAEQAEGVFLVAREKAELPDGENYYNADDVFWLSRIIQAESGGEFLRGKIAVGNVVLNRVRSTEFPDTIYEVIFDIRFGVQFSPVASGSVYRTPSAESVIAAKLCLGGAEIDREMVYFYNPRKSDSTWMVENCTFVGSIGNHDFFS